MAKEFTDDNFETEVLNSALPVLVDFWAEWCGPCKMVGPIVEELAKDFADRAVVGKVNVDEFSALSSKYGITSIPTLMVFKGGKNVDQVVGAQNKTKLKDFLTKHL